MTSRCEESNGEDADESIAADSLVVALWLLAAREIDFKDASQGRVMEAMAGEETPDRDNQMVKRGTTTAATRRGGMSC